MANSIFKIEWHWIEFGPADTWSVVLAKLRNAGISEKDLSRTVYAIRLSAKFGINYPKGVSPTLYVGEGHLKQRVDAHRKWLKEMEKIFGPLKLQLAVSTPRVRNNKIAYKEVEAALIQFFIKKYGSAPFKNSDIEYQKFDHVFEKKSLSEALMPGSGTRYYWAVEPTKINKFYSVFHRTHKAS